MPLIIEDGSIVAGANSFTTDVEFAAYAGARGYTLPATEAERDQLQIKAVDYIFSVEREMLGSRTNNATQELPYPRQNVYIRCDLLDENTIPQELKNAQMELAIAANSQELLVNSSGGNVKKERLAELEVEYYSGGSWARIDLQKANVYLDVLLCSQSDNLMVRV